MWSHVYSHKTIKIVPSLAQHSSSSFEQSGMGLRKWFLGPGAPDIRRMMGEGRWAGEACLIKHKRKTHRGSCNQPVGVFWGLAGAHRPGEVKGVLAVRNKI